jgi:hypothetical protein
MFLGRGEGMQGFVESFKDRYNTTDYLTVPSQGERAL